MRDFRELKVWQTGHQLALDIRRLTETFPRTETYGLSSQLRRAAVSVGANIAEGSARPSDASVRRFLVIAHGSVAESQCLLLIASDLGYADQGIVVRLNQSTRDLRRMLNGFIRRLKPAQKERHQLTANG